MQRDTNGSITDNINDRNVRHEEKKRKDTRRTVKRKRRETTKIKCNGIGMILGNLSLQ